MVALLMHTCRKDWQTRSAVSSQSVSRSHFAQRTYSSASETSMPVALACDWTLRPVLQLFDYGPAWQPSTRSSRRSSNRTKPRIVDSLRLIRRRFTIKIQKELAFLSRISRSSSQWVKASTRSIKMSLLINSWRCHPMRRKRWFLGMLVRLATLPLARKRITLDRARV